MSVHNTAQPIRYRRRSNPLADAGRIAMDVARCLFYVVACWACACLILL